MAEVRPPLVCHGHSRPIVELNYSPETKDGYFLVSASKDGQPMLRRGDTGDWVGTFVGHKGCVWSCVLNKTAELAATGSADFHANLWDALSGDLIHSWEHKHIVRCVHFASDGHRLATGCQDKSINVYDCNSPSTAAQSIPGLEDSVRTVHWLNNDRQLLMSFLSKPGMMLWDLRANREAIRLQSESPVTAVDITPDGRCVTTANATNIQVYDSMKMAVVRAFKTEYPVESASLSLEAGLLVAGGGDMWGHVIDFNTGRELQVNKGHHGPVHSIQFAPDGKSFASGSEDGTIRIWFPQNAKAYHAAR